MAEASVMRDRAGELVGRGEQTAGRTAPRGPTLASIVAQWQQSVGNRGVAQMSAMADDAAPAAIQGAAAGAAGAGPAEGEPPVGAAPDKKSPAVPGAGEAGLAGAAGLAGGADVAAPPTPAKAGEQAAPGVIDPKPIEPKPIDMEPMVITASAPTKASEPAEIEMPAMDVSAERAKRDQSPAVPGKVAGRSEPDAIEMKLSEATVAHPQAKAMAEIEMPAMDVSAERANRDRSAVPDKVAGRSEPGIIETEPLVGTASAPAPSKAGGTDQPSKVGDAKQNVNELTKPGFTEKNAAIKAKPQMKAAKGPPSGGGAGGGGRRGGGGGRGKSKPSLGDPTLDKWKAAVSAGAEAVKPDDLTEAKNGPAEVAKKGSETNTARKAAQTDPTVDAKSKQPPLPKEEPKQKGLNTAEADSAIAAVETAGKKRLTDQSFGPIGTPPRYEGATLTGSDYVPKNLRTDLADLEAELAKTTDKTKQAELTKKLDRLKERIATIEANGGKGTAAEPPKAIHDEGPASLTPPDPAMGDVLGDAIARAMQSVEPRSKEIVKSAVTAAHGDKVPKMLEMGSTEEGNLQQELRTELTGIAAAAGVSKEQLDTKIKEQQDVVAKQTEETETAVHVEATKVVATREDQAKQEGDAIAGAKTTVQQEIDDKQAAAEGPPDTEAIEAKRDELLGKLEATGGAAYAGLKASLIKRHGELDAGAAEKKQMVNQAANTQAAAIRRHWANDTDPNKAMVEARPTADWGVAEAGRVDSELKRLKAAATAEHDAFVQGVTGQLQPGKDKIRDWAAHQEGRERSWWERLIDMFRDWGKQANASNEAWEKQRNAESRESMTQDLNVLADLKKAQLDKSQEAYSEAMGKLTKEQQVLAQKYLAGGIDSIGFVAESTMMRIAGRRKPELAKTFEERAIAEWDWESLGQLARATNPGFQPKVLANKVHGGVDGWGTNEGKVYEGLGGARTAVERASLDKCYTETFGSSMAEDVRDDMDDKELDRAEALMSGDSAKADAAAIAEAVDGLGTDEKAIREALRGKTPEELEAIKAAYREKYGVDLVADLRDDMGGAELDNALALADGDTDKADAAELEDAMSGPGTDEDKMKQVYERIRQEEQKYAMSHGLTKAELDQRIRDRNSRVGAKYAAMGYGDLKANAKDELSDGEPLAANNADNKLFDALQAGDESKIDAAKALVERQSVYTSDDEVENIVRNQRTKAEFEVNLDEAGEKARLLALAQAGDIPADEYKAKMAEFDPKNQANKDRKEALIQAKGKENMTALKADYEGMANTDVSVALFGKETFDTLVEEGTSGYSKDEINALIDAGGKLSPEQEIFYAVAGAGTDEAKIKETLKDKTPAEVDKIRKDYEAIHGKGSFDSDILGDLSGREDLDVGLTLKYGDPSTFAKQLDEAKPEDRAKLLAGFENYLTSRRDFEKSGNIGAAMDLFGDGMNSSDQLEDAITRAKDYDKALTTAEQDPKYDPLKKGEDPNLVAAQANFDMNFQGAVQAQEEVREQIDAFADIAAQVGGAIAGIAVTILTAGTAGPAVLALYAAAASAAASIALKMSLKGAAYGWEDLGIDLAVGLVDGVMSYATAGLGKAAMASLEHAVMSQAAKMAAKEGAEEITESAVKAFIKEAIEEGIENGIQAVPSAFVGGVLNGEDPLAAAKGAGMAGLQGAGMGMGIHSAKTAGGAALSSIKGALKDEPNIETKGPTGGHVDEPNVGEPHAGATEPKTTAGDVPGEKPPDIDLPPAADPKAITAAAADGKLPADAHVDEGQLKKGATPEPHEPGPKEASTPHDGNQVKSTEPHERDAPSFPEREPATAKGGPSPDDVGKSLSPEDLTKRYGMPEANVTKIKDICKAEGVIVDIRPTTPHAAAMLEGGTALPKPEAIKAKSITQADVDLGLASKENLGKVGFFPPEKIQLPENFDQLDPKLQDELLARAKQRQAEWHDYQEEMATLLDEGKIDIGPDGVIINKGLVDLEGELPFTGDHDIYDIRQADGRPLSPEKYEKVVDKLIEADCGVEHGAANNWKLDSEATFNEQALAKMEANHSAGGQEPLVRLGAGEPHAVWHEPYEIPEGTIFFDEGVAAMDAKANHDYFKKLAAAEPNAEFALMRNTETGEYMVMQGNGGEVPIGQSRGMVEAKPDQQIGAPSEGLKPGGHWVVEAHSHPLDLETGLTPEYNRLPSGASGDMRALVRESIATGQARTSELHIVTENGPDVTRFGFDPKHKEPYMIDFPDANGERIVKRFATIEEYHGWYATQHGTVASLGDIPADFEGPRFKPGTTEPHVPASEPNTDFADEPPTNPGGRRTPDDTSVKAVEKVDDIENLQAEQERAAAADRRGESEFADEDLESLESLDEQQGQAVEGEPHRMSELVDPENRWDIEKAQAGNEFNAAQRGVYAAEELRLENGKVVDGYTPGEAIVSRKRTQLGEISPELADKYLNELLDKYGPGNLIADTPYNRANYPLLVGQRLEGPMILEVSVQQSPIPQELAERARRWGVTIRDFNGTVLN